MHKTDILPSAPLVTNRQETQLEDPERQPFIKNRIHFETARLFEKSHSRGVSIPQGKWDLLLMLCIHTTFSQELQNYGNMP